MNMWAIHYQILDTAAAQTGHLGQHSTQHVQYHPFPLPCPSINQFARHLGWKQWPQPFRKLTSPIIWQIEHLTPACSWPGTLSVIIILVCELVLAASAVGGRGNNIAVASVFLRQRQHRHAHTTAHPATIHNTPTVMFTAKLLSEVVGVELHSPVGSL